MGEACSFWHEATLPCKHHQWSVYCGRYRHFQWDPRKKPDELRMSWTDVLHNGWDPHMTGSLERHVEEPMEYLGPLRIEDVMKTMVVVCPQCLVNMSMAVGMAVL